jgi:quercetin dioxygenase-like cupin family protein
LDTTKAKSKRTNGFPTVITALPEANIPFQDAKAWILQGEKHQLVFFEIQPTAQVPEHSHNYPQWGILVEGKMKLTINDKTKTIKKGDEYLVPTQAKHHSTFQTRTRIIEFFSEKTRYETKTLK